ncbi:hypothetical protein HA402_002773 [Bradysia odoriphaga]|nr:hypothetical protein HA402_002773 [Bradysia odoriphaga]
MYNLNECKHRDENLERNNNTNNINDNNSQKHIKCDEKLCFLRLKIGLHNINDKKHHYDTSEQQFQWSTNSLLKKKSKCNNVFKFMKDLLKRKLANSVEEARYIEIPANIKVINNNLNNSSNTADNHVNKFHVMQDVRIRVEQQQQNRSNHGSPNHQHHQHNQQQRPVHLFPKQNLNCENNVQNNIPSRSPSSEEDNSPTEMNNCRRLIDKPPLVKRLTMGLLRSTEDSRPLVHNNPSPTSGSTQTISDGYVNEGICDPDKIISSKFGDSCRKSLTSVMDKGCVDTCEFDLKKNFLRETSSANSSPKIFGPSLRLDGLSLIEQHELKGAPWFQAGLPREISLEVLSRQTPGAFLVRQSSTKPGCFALSLRVPPPAPKVAHYLILKTPRGYKIKGFTKEFTSLRALITHHSVMPELLPVPLALPRPHNIIPQRRHLDDFDSYGSLNDFRKMMSDLNV